MLHSPSILQHALNEDLFLRLVELCLPLLRETRTQNLWKRPRVMRKWMEISLDLAY
jgi:hypothetical protein